MASTCQSVVGLSDPSQAGSSIGAAGSSETARIEHALALAVAMRLLDLSSPPVGAAKVLVVYGERGGTRTHDPLIKRRRVGGKKQGGSERAVSTLAGRIAPIREAGGWGLETADPPRAVHYVGSRGDRFWNAFRIWGGPRVIHRW